MAFGQNNLINRFVRAKSFAIKRLLCVNICRQNAMTHRRHDGSTWERLETVPPIQTACSSLLCEFRLGWAECKLAHCERECRCSKGRGGTISWDFLFHRTALPILQHMALWFWNRPPMRGRLRSHVTGRGLCACATPPHVKCNSETRKQDWTPLD